MGNTQANSRTSMSSVDGAILLEAHGLIADMLSDPYVPPHIVSGLRAVATLLAPPNTLSPLPNIRNKSTRISISLADFNNSESDSEENPYLGERTSNISKLSQKGKRNLPLSVIRRMSTSTWTTTTSATGLPTLEPEPSRKRSTSFRNLNQTNLLHVKNLNVLKTRSYSTTSLPIGVLAKLQNIREVSSGDRLQRLRSRQSTAEEEEEEEEEKLADSKSSLGFQKVIPRLNLTSDYDSSNSGSELAIDEANQQLAEVEKSWMKCTQCGAYYSASPPELEPIEPGTSEKIVNLRWPFVDLPPPLTPRLNPSGHYIIDNVCYDLEAIHHNPLLTMITEWDYPIFELHAQLGDTILSQMAYFVFTQTGIMEAFRIPMTEFLFYFHSLESGYRNKPYHNRMHAADVLQGVYYLTTQPIPGFVPIPECAGSSFDSPAHKPYLNPKRQLTRTQSPTEDSYGTIGANYPALELMALYTAAAMHDYDHPGRTNAFLVATYAPQAILYNDRSVLENHHSAAAWSLFFSKPKYNWLRHLDKAEFKRFRYLVIEYILATDLKRHFEILAEFNAKVNEDDSPGVDWLSEADRLLVLQMTIKLADINGPCKEHSIHVQWTKRIADEFYEQGDEELRLGLPVSPYMDRKNPQLAKLQESFINHLVAPLCSAYGEAGLLPGSWEYEEENVEESEQKRSVVFVVDERGKLHTSEKEARSRKVNCIQTKHLQDNYEYWIGQLKEKRSSLEMSVQPSTEETVQSPAGGSILEEIIETETESEFSEPK